MARRKKQPQPRRAARIKFDDGSEKDLELGLALEVDTKAKFIYLEEMKDGRWRLTLTKNMISSDHVKLDSIEIIREENAGVTQ